MPAPGNLMEDTPHEQVLSSQGLALSRQYAGYIDCLNRQAWSCLGDFVHDGVEHNHQALGLVGYRAMLEADFVAIPDLRFVIAERVLEPPRLACRLHFDCTPVGTLFGLPVNGRRVSFDEHVFYEFHEGKILRVRSVIDKAAVAAQLEHRFG